MKANRAVLSSEPSEAAANSARPDVIAGENEAPGSPALDQATRLVVLELRELDRFIQDHLHSDIALIRQMGAYIIHSGGKRLRPLCLLLGAKALGYTGQHHIALAAVIEFIHTATLLHDDVVDDSDLRRGKETANSVWGNEASVLVGDFLYSRSFEIMVDVGDMKVMEIMAHTTNSIAEGEVMQLLNTHSPDITESEYLKTIYRKTATLFESASMLSAIISTGDAVHEQCLKEYGAKLGTAFQIVDDALDYTSTADAMGKNTGDDLAEGKPTLPLIHAMSSASEIDRQLIRKALTDGDRDQFGNVLEIIEKTGAIEATISRARTEAQAAATAISPLPDSKYKEALLRLTDFAVTRKH